MFLISQVFDIIDADKNSKIEVADFDKLEKQGSEVDLDLFPLNLSV